MSNLDEELLRRLNQTHVRLLVPLLFDFVLHQPIRSLFPVSLVASQISLALQALVEGDETERWVAAQIDAVREQIPEGHLGTYVPTEVQAPLRNLLQQEMVLQQDLVRNMLAHQAVEQLFQEILTEVLKGFTESLKSMVQSATSTSSDQMSRGFGRLKSFGERALKESAVGGFVTLLEQQAQRKIREYLEKSITATLDLTAEKVASLEHRPLQAQYRLHVLNVLLETDNTVLWSQIEVVETQVLVSTIAQTIRSILKQDEFPDLLRSGIEMGMEQIGDQSIQHLVESSGADHDWRSELEEQVEQMALQFTQQPEFLQWLSGLLHGLEKRSSGADGR